MLAGTDNYYAKLQLFFKTLPSQTSLDESGYGYPSVSIGDGLVKACI